VDQVAALQELLRNVTSDAVDRLAGIAERRRSGERPGQYALDLEVDGPMVESLVAAGLGVLSEEAGEVHGDRALIAVVDPVDGSTNASRGVPWFATSIAVVDDDGPLVSLVQNHATGERFEAVRGGGATRNGVRLAPPMAVPLSDAIVAINGVPPSGGPWAQFRTLGASALDINYVAAGAFDGYIDCDDEAHGVWDYLGALLVCDELGVPAADAYGRPLVHRDLSARRTPIVAHSKDRLEEFRRLRVDGQ